MKIAVVNNFSPFERGGAELLAEALVSQLETNGHQAELIRVPLDYTTPERVFQSAVSARLLEVPNVDQVICLKFPAYLVRHPNKVIWLIHQFRQVYDLWNSPAGWKSTPETDLVKSGIQELDKQAFGEARKILAISNVIASRAKKYSDCTSRVLMSPPHRVPTVGPSQYSDYIIAPGRITRGKRQDLAVRALKFMEGSLRLIVAGPMTGQEDYVDEMRDIADRDGTRDRVEFRTGFLSETELDGLVANSRAVFYAPFQEDSYGYVSYEAAIMERPVVTTSDAGGVLDLIRDKYSGLVVSPTASSIAKAFMCLEDTKYASVLGRGAKTSAEDLGLNWELVIRELLG